MKRINKIALALIFLFGLAYNSNGQQIISIDRSIEIDVSDSVLLDYVSNLENDPIWRAEVDSMVMISSEKYGEGAIEYSSFKKGKTITPSFISNQDENSIQFETPDTVQYYLSSIRTIEKLENGKTLITYTLVFDNYMTKLISPVKIPKFITKMFYGTRMKKYLKVLKNNIESSK